MRRSTNGFGLPVTGGPKLEALMTAGSRTPGQEPVKRSIRLL